MSVIDKLLRTAGLTPREAPNHELRFRVLIIGPREAEALLAANKDNRRLRWGRVRFYARVMRNGGWMLTHQGLAFSSDGTGLDLQHRLHAVILAGVEITIVTVEGLSPKTFEAIDQHERRSISDALRLNRSLTEEAKMFFLLRGGDGSANPSLAEIAEVCGDIAEEHDLLEQFCSTRRAIYSAVPVRCAAITLMVEAPRNAPAILSAYRDLVLCKTEVWTRAMHAFGRQVNHGKTISTSASIGRIDLFARALAALDPARKELSKIQIDESTIFMARKRAAAAIGFKDSE